MKLKQKRQVYHEVTDVILKYPSDSDVKPLKC